MIEAVMRLWDMGLDTKRMSTVLQEPEAMVERALHFGLNDRRKEKEKQS